MPFNPVLDVIEIVVLICFATVLYRAAVEAKLSGVGWAVAGIAAAVVVDSLSTPFLFLPLFDAFTGGGWGHNRFLFFIIVELGGFVAGLICINIVLKYLKKTREDNDKRDRFAQERKRAKVSSN